MSGGIAVINASKDAKWEVDDYVDYRDGVGEPFNKRCTSWHSLAACMNTEFFVYGKPGWQGVFKYDKVIVLVESNMKDALPLIKKLKLKSKVGIAYHEGMQALTFDINNALGLKQLADQADFYLTIFPTYDIFFKSFLSVPVYSCYHAWPYNEWDLKDIKVSFEEKKGILIGTRTIKQHLLRNSLISLMVVSGKFKEVTYLNEDGPVVNEFIEKMGCDTLKEVSVINGPLSYKDWLSLIAKHKFVYHHDLSMNFGQINGDAALVDTLCVGSTTEMNKLSFTGNTNLYGNMLEMERCGEKGYNYKLDIIKQHTSFKALRSKLERIFDNV